MIYVALRHPNGDLAFGVLRRHDGRQGRLECCQCGNVIRKGSYYRLHAELADGTTPPAHDACAVETMGYR